MNRDLYIKAIKDYILNVCGEPETWPKKYFFRISNSKWVMEEVLHTIINCPSVEPEVIFEEYISKFDMLSEKNPHTRKIFEEARDTLYDFKSAMCLI